MSITVEALNGGGRRWLIALAGAAGLIIVAMTMPSLQRSRMDAVRVNQMAETRQVAERMTAPSFADKIGGASQPVITRLPVAAALQAPGDAAGDRKIVRNASVDLVVQKPAQTIETIRGLAENAGGFLVTSNVGGGQNATRGSVTIRVPAARFNEVWTEVRKLGVRVDAEHIEAQDVTRQYV